MADCCDNFILDEAQDDFGFSGGIGGTLPISMGGTGATTSEVAAMNIIGPLPTVSALDEYDKVLIQQNSTAAIRKRRADAFAQDMWDLLYKDSEPIEDSTAPITSGAVYRALGGIFSPVKYATPGPLVHFSDGGYNQPVQGMKIAINPVQSGEGDPSPDNVRPISGWTAANVTRTGKNMLMNINDDVVEAYGITYTKNVDGSVMVNGATDNNYASYYNLTYGTTYASSVFPCARFIWRTMICSISEIATPVVARVTFWKADKSYVQPYSVFNTSQTFVVPDDAEYFRIFLQVPKNTTVKNVTVYPMLCLASESDGSYEPYNSTTYDISFPSEAGTIYGGTLTYNGDRTWTLTVDRSIETFDGSEEWTVVSGTLPSYRSKRKTIPANASGLVCNKLILDDTQTLVSGHGYIGTTNIVCFFPDASEDNLAAWKASLAASPMQVVYYDVNPTTYTLTGPEVLTLLGENNIFADTGDIEELAYRADIGLYLVQALNPIKEMLANRESSMTATRNYTTGAYIIVGNTFYKVLTNIASGTSLTVNGNVRITTVGAELKTALV